MRSQVLFGKNDGNKPVEKGLIVRTLGSEDRRQMYFTLSAAGRERVCDMEIQKVEIPELLKPLFKDAES